jgi:nitroimidazol reductase NimA-like FMN-containing flavoprotein (pyridoxamine 5'-phosphate oxidase superfamily)
MDKMAKGGRPPVSRLEELSHEECLRQLAYGSYVGHVGFVRDGRPMILPVNYLFDNEGVVFRTNAGTQLSDLDGAQVAFEVDDSQPLARSGWSVLVHGTAQRITDDDEADRLRRGPLRAWAWRLTDLWFRVSIDDISGRRIVES